MKSATCKRPSGVRWLSPNYSIMTMVPIWVTGVLLQYKLGTGDASPSSNDSVCLTRRLWRRGYHPFLGWTSHTKNGIGAVVVVMPRGGSSSINGDDNDDDDDDEWLRVNAVVDVQSLLDEKSDKDDATHVETAAAANQTTKLVPRVSAELKDDGLRVDAVEGQDIADESEKNATFAIEEAFCEEGEETIANVTEEEAPTWIFSASKPGDGSESDPDGLPSRYLRMMKGNREHAKEAFAATLEWRKENDVDTILARPHPKFDACKAVLPHYFAGRDRANHPIFVQRPGLIDLDLAHRNNVTMEDLLVHYIYVMEYCWNILEPGPPDGVMTNVLDMTGASFSSLNKETIGFIKHFVQMMSLHYPQRSYRTFIINAPRWFGGIYRLIKPLLRESTKKKIQILTSGPEQDAVLREFLGEESFPKDLHHASKSTAKERRRKKHVGEIIWEQVDDDVVLVKAEGGIKRVAISPEPGPYSEMELELRSFCIQRMKELGEEPKEVVQE